MLTLLHKPEFLLAVLVAFVAGALLMLGMLTALDALESRRTGKAKTPRPAQTNSWGTHSGSARAELRSAPR